MKRTSLPLKAMAAWLVACAACAAWPAGAQNAATREQNAATQRQTQKTERANRAATVGDETGEAAQAARTEQTETRQYEAAQDRRNGGSPPPSYGPVLNPRGQQAADPARKNPAEVHDEADTQSRQAPQPSSQAPQQQSQQQRQPARKPPQARRHPAWQPDGPMAPRPLRSAEGARPAGVKIPAPAAAPQPVVPSSNVVGGCPGGVCADASGTSYNGLGSGNAGTSSSGRLCTRTGVTVQCF